MDKMKNINKIQKNEKVAKIATPIVRDSSPEGNNKYIFWKYINFSINAHIAEEAVVTPMVRELSYKQCPSPEGNLGSIPSHGASAIINPLNSVIKNANTNNK